MRKNGLIAALVFTVIGMMVVPAQAALLPTGGTLFPAPGEPDPTGGAVVGGPLVSPFAVPGMFSGTLTSTVIAGDPSNPLGGLTFTYVLSNDPGSANAMARVTVSSYAGFATDASYQLGTPGVPPTFIDRLTSDVVGFSFAGFGPGPIAPGVSTAVLVVQTDAPAFGAGIASIIDSGAVTVASYAPIPEPASLGLIGLAGALLLSRRR